MPTIALIVNTYEQPEYLSRVLRAVASQTRLPDEIILADDGSGSEMKSRFAAWSGEQSFRTEHVWQEHTGFRRSRILNEAIARTRSDYIVFLDGDTIPHPRFISDHQQLATPDHLVQGHRALIEKKAATYFGLNAFSASRRKALFTCQLSGIKHAYRWPAPLRKARTDLRGVRGCNLAIWRKDLVRVNGYNEAFEGWGREDSELCVRLMNSGVSRTDVRGWALCYHLWHPPASRGQLNTNDHLLQTAIDERWQVCQTGLSQHLHSSP